MDQRAEGRRDSSWSAAFVLAAVAVSMTQGLASAQETRWSRIGAPGLDQLGRAVAWVEDRDGDGRRDFAAGAPTEDAVQQPRVIVCSSSSGALLLEIVGQAGSRFGARVDAIGDLDADGRSELLIAAPGAFDAASNVKGMVFVYDAAGNETWRWRDGVAGSAMEIAVVIDDVDGDSVRDVAALLVDPAPYAGTIGRCEVLSGASGSGIRSITGLSNRATNAVSIGDVDLDGVGDLLFPVNWFPYRGSSSAYSGATGSFLYSVAGWNPDGAVASLGDVDGDAVPDFVRAGYEPESRKSYLNVHSGDDGVAFAGASASSRAFVPAGDFDGDGVTDFVSAEYSSVFELVVRSGVTALELARLPTAWSSTTELDGAIDFDGDGTLELLCGLGDEPDPAGSGATGGVAILRLSDGAVLFERTLEGTADSHFGDGVALAPDRDGDGVSEILMASLAEAGDVAPQPKVQVLSSVDGRTLAQIPVAGGIGAGGLPLIGLSDVDGDQVDDWAFASVDGTVEVRSGVDDALQKSWSLPMGEPIAIAAATDAAGHALLAVVSYDSAAAASEIRVRDVAADADRLVVTAKKFRSVACIGDVDGDGALDWVGCDVSSLYGKVVAYSGASGATLWSHNGASSQQYHRVVSVGDLSGDGKDDVVLSGLLLTPREVYARSGVDGAKLFEIQGPPAGDEFATSCTGISDVNRDGYGDFAVGAPGANGSAGFIDLYSGKTARLLRRVDGSPGSRFGERFAALSRGASMTVFTGDRRRPGLVTSAPTFGAADSGRVDLIALSDLFLEIDPSIATDGQTVFGYTRGGKAGAFAGLYVVAVDGVPVDQFGAFGFLASFGEWTTSNVVPPGLSGTVFALRSYTIGVDGRLSVSTCETLTIQ